MILDSCRNRRRGFLLVQLTCLFTAACREDQSVTAPGESLRASPPGTQTGSSPQAVRPEEAAFLQLADRSPSSAGFYIDVLGRLVVVVRDPADENAARATAEELISIGKVRDSRVTSSSIVIQRGRYTFHQLSGWRDLVFDQILGSREGVLSVDFNEKDNGVTIGIAPDANDLRPALQDRLLALGVDTGAVTFRVHEPLSPGAATRSRGAMPMAPATLNSATDTLVGGIEIQTAQGTCTLGIVVDYPATPPFRGLMTASHCSQSQWSSDYSAVYQPVAPRSVGWESLDPAGWSCGFLNANKCRNSDASFYTIYQFNSERGLIARTLFSRGPGQGNGSLTVDQINPYFIVTELDQQNSYTGQYVQKIGRTTGWTWGVIGQTCVDHQNGSWPGQKVTKCTYEADYTQSGGDSGAPVFMFPGGSSGGSGEIVTLVGLQLGSVSGNAVFSKWGRISMDFGALPATRPTTLAQPSVSGSLSQSRPSLSWPSVAGAAKYNVYRAIWNGSSYSTALAGSPTSPTFLDASTTAYGYYGAAQPAAPSTAVQYFVYALNQAAVSPKSSPVWFSTTPLTTSISGPSFVSAGTTQSWTAVTWGGAVPYAFQWFLNGQPVATTQTLTLVVGQSDFELRVNATDPLNALSTATLYVTVSQCPPPQVFCDQ